MDDPRTDHELAADLAVATGEVLLAVREREFANGTEPATIKEIGDFEANRFLMAALREARPTDPILSEEEKSTPPEVTAERLASRRTWIVDPVDGTREFSEVGRDDWAVHVAVCHDGSPVAGAVALPAQGLVYSTASPPAVPAHDGPIRFIVSRTRPQPIAVAVREALGGVLVEMGSAGAKAMAIVGGHADAYLHAGGQYEWDSCAPVAVARAAGLWCSRLDGSPLAYNNADPMISDLLICRAELAEEVLAAANSTT